ncbi:MAG: glyceraldehyde-3-phosphate dehydrogenase [Rothia sp. (in: high G+C Gram-positive bacteria)]|uniref:glyceraldehyde-3-phosphate dehydrogenase n=1 Tax=Rothia sp. (in: high G+C Gram-positive bacteria) TaxID=1885016 RepID=UPI0026DF8D23|nr:glyceraldehyde-3-phosphate dehydrogenase [Rothia sp. (in: high G+C Gram-positive bacteria)]MDO5749656.1 glyceraldehyde-3-phosphate dehydrogenase [Rothia sp. (in: high G+C Gram-positive bacteria)]
MTTENSHEQWIARQAQAEQMIPLIGTLNRDNGVVLSIHGRSLVNKSVIQLLKLHDAASQIDGAPLNPAHSHELIRALTELNLGPCSIDVAALHHAHRDAGSPELGAWLREQLADSLNKSGEQAPTQDVVLYGFGRIGRLLARILLERSSSLGGSLRLRAVVVRKNSETDLHKRASLLERDSVHGPFRGTIEVDEANDTIIANGVPVRFIYSSDPKTVDYTEYGINDALLVDNTGRWRDVEGLSQHLERPGISRVLLTAPGKGDMKNIVFGVNDSIITDEDKILSAASCTTNAITPVLKVLDDQYGVAHGHVETVHAFTNDQNLIDNFHKGDRRGRSAVLNMVITETGAAKAVSKALPQLEGKLTGSAIRVPTPDVSIAVLNLKFKNPGTSKEELNELFRQVSLNGQLRRQIGYSDSHEAVSTDFVGSRNAGVVDSLATVVNEDGAVLYVWYDNEFGYSCQVVRVLERMAGDSTPSYPAR